MSISKTILITGATSGIGKEAALELARQGNEVIFTTRNIETAEAIKAEFDAQKKDDHGSLDFIFCNLSSFESVVKACNSFLETHHQLDILINNAGVWNFEPKVSINKIEETFHVNVLSPSLLKSLLLPAMEKSGDARIIQTASALHYGNIDFDNMEGKKKFSGFNAYRQSKLSIILLTRWWAKSLQEKQIGVYALHPGLVNTKLGRNAGWFANLFFKFIGISPKKGAQTIIFLSSESQKDLISGEYYTKNKVKKITGESYDLATAERLDIVVNQYIYEYL
ncbi:MAG TPA: hypothetical protein DCX89_01840 [Saprospirales bacterium]|nr:hypothetical protein [Saprospirales bacterium]HAY70609.1 hypothetical protein [Saprospirales bacterium]HRQ28560.1 SDR family NAD(P)-dependent oxidoreductase [Saprospiraceae bacterium]